MTRRNKLDIIADLLRIAKRPAKKTNLLYRGRMSTKGLEIYLSFLLEKGLLTTNSPNFQCTEKGRLFLELYDKLQELLGR